MFSPYGWAGGWVLYLEVCAASLWINLVQGVNGLTIAKLDVVVIFYYCYMRYRVVTALHEHVGIQGSDLIGVHILEWMGG